MLLIGSSSGRIESVMYGLGGDHWKYAVMLPSSRDYGSNSKKSKKGRYKRRWRRLKEEVQKLQDGLEESSELEYDAFQDVLDLMNALE
jgi:hypothetical protein